MRTKKNDRLKPKSKSIVVVGILNELHWLGCYGRLLNGERIYFNPEQAEILRLLWGKGVKIILDEETNYLKQIEEVK